jgi:molecular chaperone DnaK (HSP70)
MIIGIDLGTTFSVLAVDGQVELTEGYPPPTYLEELDVSIIPDPYGNEVIPSAVWEDPDAPGELIVGSEARDRGVEGQAPILFSKRNIGTDVLHRLSGREYTAREVAAIILRYLKGIAEQALGERITQAVITHPAFFEGSMMRETADAARDAGFEFDQEKHLLMEPTAAALAYVGADPRDPLRLLTYDLGGGTFDITVMERHQGVVTVKAFGGNRLLGGYTFDRRLATWLYDRMRERGVPITAGDEDPRALATWTRLLRVAEDTKFKLARARTDKMPVHVREQLTDDNGRTFTLVESINRAQFTELIADLLDETIDGQGEDGGTKGCEAVLAQAGLTIAQIDEILLVGGSSWGPWVEELIQRKWDREAVRLEPDRIVGAGAALHARTLPKTLNGAGCTVRLDVDPRSPLETTTIAGEVEAEQAMSLAVVLTDDGGVTYVDTPDESGRFVFEDVELRPRATTRFTLTVGEGEHRNLAEHHFEVEQIGEDADEVGADVSVLTVLPKPLFIEVADGMEPLADVGETLPTRRTLEFRRVNAFDTIEIRLFQEHDHIGSVVIRDVPPEATVGSKVALTVEISRSNRIEGRATVHTRTGTVIREAPVDISIPRMEVPPLPELQDKFVALEKELEEKIELGTDAATRMRMSAEGNKLRRKIKGLLDAPAPDRQEVWLTLRVLERAVSPPRDELEPPRADFEDLLLRIRDLLAAHPDDPNLQATTRVVDRLDKEGRAAHNQHDARKWRQVNDNLRSLYNRIARPHRPGSGGGELPPADIQKMAVTMRLDQVRQELRAKEAGMAAGGDADRLRTRTDRIRAAIDEVQALTDEIPDDMPAGAASGRIQMVMSRVRGISEDIRLIDRDLGV